MKKAALIALIAFSSPTFAAGYAGIGIGQASVDIEAIDFGPGVTATVDDKDTAFKFFGGVEITPGLALEFTYADFGEAGVYYTDGIGWVKEAYEASAMSLAAVGSVPLGGANLFGKFGFARWDLDGSISASDGSSASGSWSGTEPVVGIGLAFNAGSMLLRAEFERYMDVGDENDTGQTDIDVVGVSAAVKF